MIQFTPERINTKFSLNEHLKFVNQLPKGSSPFRAEFNFEIYETLHIVDIFDEAVKDISNLIMKSAHGEVNLLDVDGTYILESNFWYLPGDDHCYTTETKPDNSKQIWIALDNSDRKYLMQAEGQDRDKDHIIITLNVKYLGDLFDTLPYDEIHLFIKQTLKHEFKHIRTIWSNPNYDVAYSKKYASDPVMSEYELAAARKHSYTIFNTLKLCYYLNPEEALAHINGIYAKIQNTDAEDLRRMFHEIKMDHFMKSFESYSQIISIFDKDYYFPILIEIVEDLKKYERNLNLQYELYNFPRHSYELGFIKDLKINKWYPDISYEDFLKKSEEERIDICNGTIQLIIKHISEIKRKLISAISKYFIDNGI